MKRKIKYILFFIFVFIGMSFFTTSIDGDVLWNYGFGYAIRMGEIPYKDFNMIITPFYPFLMSLFLLFSKNIIFFYLANSLLITLIFYLLEKILKGNTYLFYILLVFPLPIMLQSSYNILLVLFIILLIYLEKKDYNDYLIGIIVGLTILTKQSVGVFLIIPTLIYYYKKPLKIIKRFISIIIICGVFLLYLLFTNSFNSFMDLCFFGLLDFSNKNGFHISFSFCIGILLLLVTIVLTIRNKKDIKYFYILMFSSIMIPLFDFNHVTYYLFVFSIILMDRNMNSLYLKKYSIIFMIVFAFIFFLFNIELKSIEYPNHYNNFNYRLMFNSNGENIIRDKVINYINKNKDKNIIIISSDAYFYQITMNRKIDYYSLNNYGNHGYNGTSKMYDRIDKLSKGTIIIINMVEINNRSNSLQFNWEVAEYASKCGKLIKKIDCFGIYEIV